MQNSHAVFYTLAITVVILWPPYKVEHHPQTYPAAYVPQHLRFHSQVWWASSAQSSNQTVLHQKGRVLWYFGSTENKKNTKPQQTKKHLSQSLEVQACLHPVINCMYVTTLEETDRHLIARRHELPGFQEVVAGLCQGLSVLLINPEVIELPNTEEATPNDQVLTL